MLLFSLVSVIAQKPLVGSWFANDVMNWTPEKDVNARFNRSTIKLQSRFEDKTLLANPYQQYDGKICNATIMWNRCGAQPSQGAFDFASYSFTHWQYVDMMIYWAGSAAEGIICPPAASWTDAAHANGVIILGQIFLNGSWGCGPASKDICTQMFKRENADGRSEFAKQLYAITKYYGFDGWFVNEEYGGGSYEEYRQFFEDYYYYAEKDGNKHYMQWYNAGWAPSSLIVNAHPNTSQFLEYGARYECKTAAEFMKYFSGQEVVKGGLDGGDNLYKYLFNKDGHKGSVDLFCPEEHIWKNVLKEKNVDAENYDDPSRCGDKAYAAQEKIFTNESRYFVNRYHDPSNNTAWNDNYWPGFATTCAERSSITQKPFFTAFGNGLGKHRFVNGKKEGTKDWFHIGMQDILPTWRWWITNNATDALTVKPNWDDAYQFGSSYAITGKLTANQDHVMRLYKTQLTIESGDKFQFVYKTNTANSLNVQFGTKEGNHQLANLPAPTLTVNNGWTVAEYDLSALIGKTVSVIALNIRSNSSVSAYSATLGQMMLSNGHESAIGKVQNLTMQNKMGVEGGDIRMYWDAPATGAESVHHYDLYINQNGSRSLIGQTKDCAFYINNIKRQNMNDKGPTIDVVPVSLLQTQGELSTLTQSQFPEPGAPEVMIMASKTLVNTGTTVTFTAVATQFPTSYEWTVPAGATNVSYNQTKTTMTCTLNQLGDTDVTITVANSKGTTVHTETGLVEVSNEKVLKILSVNKTIDSSSDTKEFEGPQFLIDGEGDPSNLSEKWCVNQAAPWVIIDLENVYKIYRFDIYDCKLKEDGDNVKDYDIEVSLDKVNWIKVFSKTGNQSKYHLDWCKPTVAQYVRWNIKWAQPTTIRVWEFEVWGTETGVNLNSVPKQTMTVNQATPVVVSYDMNEEKRSSDFRLEVSSPSSSLKFSNIVEDEPNRRFTFNVKGAHMGFFPVVMKLTNKGLTKTATFEVEVKDPSATNILLNVQPSFAQALDAWSKFQNLDPAVSAKATDGNRSTGVETLMYSDGKNVLEFTYSFDAPYMVSKFEIEAPAVSHYEVFDNFEISVSEDGNTFTKVYAGPLKDEVWVSPTPAKAYNFVFGKSVYTELSVNELRAIGVAASSIKPSTPEFSVAAGQYTGTQLVELSTATDEALIHYTTDGSDPTTASALYEGPI
ncbi:MAG: discoidin domain-containing protein, partial [Bacteroidales bacterium]